MIRTLCLVTVLFCATAQTNGKPNAETTPYVSQFTVKQTNSSTGGCSTTTLAYYMIVLLCGQAFNGRGQDFSKEYGIKAPITAAAMRGVGQFFLGTSFSVYSLGFSKVINSIRSKPLWIFIVCGIFDGMDNALFSLGAFQCGSAAAGVFASSVLVMNAGASTMVLGRKVSMAQWGAIVGIIFGLCIFAYSDLADSSGESSGILLGGALVVASVAFRLSSNFIFWLNLCDENLSNCMDTTMFGAAAVVCYVLFLFSLVGFLANPGMLVSVGINPEPFGDSFPKWFQFEKAGPLMAIIAIMISRLLFTEGYYGCTNCMGPTGGELYNMFARGTAIYIIKQNWHVMPSLSFQNAGQVVVLCAFYAYYVASQK